MRESGFDFCPGCGYGSILLALTESVANLPEPPVFMLDIGCVDFMIAHMPGDVMMGTHGRTSAFASGYKRVHPERIVIAIQGDGGFMGLGATESLHTANRGEPITVIVLNNGVLADTGGQLAPTTLAGQSTASSPGGRAADTGAPLAFLEILSRLPGVGYAERVAIDSVPSMGRLKKSFRKAIDAQSTGKYSVVEVLSPCPTHWRIDPVEAWKRVRTEVSNVYPVGILERPQL
ncbi:MAG TPA: thiamine pyrophosphate-dependent enzyme [Candidatus Dormibacteraeota bacterium]|nr:thiamine pyrophosphate-dependent enzyme [Candidatus Dormibacteraeota bacterium]